MSRKLLRDGSQNGNTTYRSMDADRLGLEVNDPFAIVAQAFEKKPDNALGPNSDHTASLLSVDEPELSLSYSITFSVTISVKADVIRIPEKSDQRDEPYLSIKAIRASLIKRVALQPEPWHDFKVFIKGVPNPPKIVCSKEQWTNHVKELALEKGENPKGVSMIRYRMHYKIPGLFVQKKVEKESQPPMDYPSMEAVRESLPGRVEGITASHGNWTEFFVEYTQEDAHTKTAPIKYTRNNWRQYIHEQATVQAEAKAESDREKAGVDLLGIHSDNGHGGGGGKKPQKALEKKEDDGANAALADLFSSDASAAPVAPKREDLPSAGESEADSSVTYLPPAPLPLRCRVSYTMPGSSAWIDEPERNARPSYKDWPALYEALVLRVLGGTDPMYQQFTFNILQGTQYYMLHGTSDAWTNHLTQPPGGRTDLIEKNADAGMYSFGRLTVFKLPSSGVKLDVINPESSARHDRIEQDGFEL